MKASHTVDVLRSRRRLAVAFLLLLCAAVIGGPSGCTLWAQETILWDSDQLQQVTADAPRIVGRLQVTRPRDAFPSTVQYSKLARGRGRTVVIRVLFSKGEVPPIDEIVTRVIDLSRANPFVVHEAETKVVVCFSDSAWGVVPPEEVKLEGSLASKLQFESSAEVGAVAVIVDMLRPVELVIDRHPEESTIEALLIPYGD